MAGNTPLNIRKHLYAVAGLETGHMPGEIDPQQLELLRRALSLPGAPVSLDLLALWGRIDSETVSGRPGAGQRGIVPWRTARWRRLGRMAALAVAATLFVLLVRLPDGDGAGTAALVRDWTVDAPASAAGIHTSSGVRYLTSIVPAVLRHPSGKARILLQPGAEVRTPAGSALDETVFSCYLVRGAAGFDIEARCFRQAVIATPTGKVTVTGTVFSVTVEPASTMVRVSRGTVRLETADGRAALALTNGQSARSDGKTVRPADQVRPPAVVDMTAVQQVEERIHLHDGTILVGTVLSQDAAGVRMQTRYGEVYIERARIRSLSYNRQ